VGVEVLVVREEEGDDRAVGYQGQVPFRMLLEYGARRR
jgi:hypothetical protein